MFETPRPPYVIAGNAASESVVGAAVHAERSYVSAVATHRRQRSATLPRFSAVLSSVTLICGALLFQ